MFLKDVRYRIWAKLIYIPPKLRKYNSKVSYFNENPKKYQEMFERRASKGQCFTQPYLGTREFSAYFALVDVDAAEETRKKPIPEDRDLGIMLYDMDFVSNPNDPKPMFYHPIMQQGVIEVPPFESKEILR